MIDESTPLISEKETTSQQEIVSILKSSLPLIFTYFLQYSLTVVSIFSVGHLGKTELAAVSLAIMTFNVTVSIFNGMATCLDTLCAQAYGAKRYDLVGLYFQKCTAMLMVIAVPVISLWWFSGSLLMHIVEDPQLAILAQTFLRYISFGSPAYILFETGKRFLQAQGIFDAGQYCLFIVAPINMLLNYFLVWNKTFGLGYIGAPISTAISYWLMAILLVLYAIFIKGRECWYGLHLKIAFDFQSWGPMVGLALNGTAMLLSEFIAFEILTLSAARFGTTALASQSIASTMASLFFQIPFAVSVAVSTRMANYVGAEKLQAASVVNKVASLFAVALGIIDCLILVVGRKGIILLFTQDEQVVSMASKVLIILGVNQLYDCPNVMFAGCLRGQGRQHIGSILNLVAYYLVAVPLGLALAFMVDLKLVGLWVGLGVGIFILATSEAIFVFSSLWEDILEASRRRNDL